jgi:hypothetical protein
MRSSANSVLYEAEITFHVGCKPKHPGRSPHRSEQRFATLHGRLRHEHFGIALLENDHKRRYFTAGPRRRRKRHPLRSKWESRHCRGVSVRSRRSVPDNYGGAGLSGRPDY